MVAAIVASTPWLVTVLNSMLAGAIGAMAVLQVGGDALSAVLIGIALFIAAIALQAASARRDIRRIMGSHRPRFPARMPPENLEE